MAYTETRTVSYGSRLSNSFKGIGTGFVLLIAATVLLWWNEGRAVHTAQDIKEVGANATHVESIDKVAPEGQLIHANGTAVTTDTIADATFGIRTNALSLARDVEYYQWTEQSHTETKEKIGGSKEEVTTYTYSKDWVSSPVNSSNFHDPQYKNANTVLANINYKDETVYAKNVSFGAYTMPEDFIHSVAACAPEAEEDLVFDQAVLVEMDKAIANTQGQGGYQPAYNNIAANDSAATVDLKWVHQSKNELYFGQNAGAPTVGDVRVKFSSKNASAVISLVAVVQGKSLTSYRTKNKANRNYISAGTKSLEEMMQDAEDDNNMMTWALRILGIILVYVGFKSIFEILVTLLKVLPFLANIFNWGVSLICGVLAFVYSLIIIAVAWIFYRPILGICLLAAAGGLIYWLAIGKKKKDANSAASVSPAAAAATTEEK